MSDYLGIYQGSVVDNNDVLGIGRVTCLVPQAQADQPTTWCNPIYPTVYKPNVGDVVWVQFVNGDLTKPIYFSSDAVTAEKIIAHSITADELDFNPATQEGLDAVQAEAQAQAQAAQDAADAATAEADGIKALTDGWVTVGTTTIDGSSITSKTVTANQLNVVMGGGNLAVNSSFADTTYALPTTSSTSLTPTYNSTHTYWALAGGLKVANTSAGALAGTGAVRLSDPVNHNYMDGFLPNLTYTLTVWTWNPSTGGVPSVSVQASGFVTATATSASSTVKDQWVANRVTFVTSATAGVAPNKPTLQVLLGGPIPVSAGVWLGAVQLEVGEIGSAYSPKSDEILPGTIASPMILADAVKTSQLDANAITTKHTLTGPTIQTSATASRGIKIVGSLLTAYDNTGVATVKVDGSTGNATLTGEFGTGPVGTAGVHISSTQFNGIFGQSTYPTVQFNIGSGVPVGFRQPQIFTDTTGTPNLYFWGGGATNVHMSQLKLDQGWARLGVEGTANSDDLLDGDRLSIKPGDVFLASSGTIDFFNNTQSARQTIQALDVIADGALQSNGTIRSNTAFQFVNVAGSSFRAISAADVNASGNVTATGDVNAVNVIATGAMQNNGTFQSGTAFQFVNVAGTIFRALNAAAFNVSSDRSLKSNLKAPSIDALTAIRNLPVYEYTLDGQDSPTIGVMADDAPEIVSGTATLDSEVTKPSTQKDVKTLDLYALVAVLVQAVQDLDKQLDDVLPDRKAKKPTRKSRSLKG